MPYPATKSITNRLLNDVWFHGLNDFIGRDSNATVPAANVSETKDVFLLALAAPGFEKENFSLQIEKDLLTITGQRVSNTEEETDRKFLRKEFSNENFKRSFNLPQTVNKEDIAAVYTNGVLNVTLPKKEEVKPLVKNIEVA